MSENDLTVNPDESDAPEAMPPAAPSQSAGTLIRAAREAAGVELSELASNLKVSPAKLAALEADQFELLPDPMFVRALASSVCRSLKIDAQLVLDRLPASVPRPFETTNTGLNTPFRASGSRQLPDFLMQGFRPWVLGVAVLLVGTLVLVFLPSLRGGAPAGNASAPALSQSLPQATPALTPVAPTTGKPAPSVVETLSLPSIAAATPNTAPKPAAVAAPPVVPSAKPVGVVVSEPVLTSAATLGSVTEGLISFQVGAGSWVEVKDAAGRFPLRRLLAAGETVDVSGTPPLNVIVGRADGVQVKVRGVPRDITTQAKDNVSRFVVK